MESLKNSLYEAWEYVCDNSVGIMLAGWIILCFNMLVIFAFEFRDGDVDMLEADALIRAVYADMEYAYYEGHRDAIEGNLRLEKVSEGCYEWTKSPWDDSDREVTYTPDCLTE